MYVIFCHFPLTTASNSSNYPCSSFVVLYKYKEKGAPPAEMSCVSGRLKETTK